MEQKQIIEITDCYHNSKHLHILTADELQIPGLFMFGKQTRTNATESLPLHFHENRFEIVYLSTGSAIFSIDDTDYKLSGGDIFLTLPNQIHSTNALPISVCEMYWFQLSVTPEHFLYLTPSAAADLLTGLSGFSSPQIHADSKELYPLIKSAFDLCVSGDNPLMAAQYLGLLLSKLIEYQRKTMFKLTPDIGRSMDYILDHLTDELSLEHLAQISHLSLSQFKQKFKNQVGFSPRQFINYEKIEYAKTLLLDGHSVTETASLLGFDNSSYFAAVFKRFQMCSPTEYRKREK